MRLLTYTRVGVWIAGHFSANMDRGPRRQGEGSRDSPIRHGETLAFMIHFDDNVFAPKPGHMQLRNPGE